jgi:hypothetical protein
VIGFGYWGDSKNQLDQTDRQAQNTYIDNATTKESKMTRSSKLTRKQAVAIVGEAAVAKAEAANCEPTGRLGYNGACHGDEEIEWSAGASATDRDGIECTVRVYYYTSQVEIDSAGDDLSNIDWVIDGYLVA